MSLACGVIKNVLFLLACTVDYGVILAPLQYKWKANATATTTKRDFVDVLHSWPSLQDSMMFWFLCVIVSFNVIRLVFEHGSNRVLRKLAKRFIEEYVKIEGIVGDYSWAEFKENILKVLVSESQV